MTRSVFAALLLGSLLVPALPARANAVPLSLEKVVQTYAHVRSWRAHMTASGPQTLDAQIEFVAPAKLHISGMGMELVSDGRATYLNTGGSWAPSPVDASAIIAKYNDPRTILAVGSSATYTPLGSRVIAGRSLRGWRIDRPASGELAASTTTLWVGADDLPYVATVKSSYNGTPVTTTIAYSDYNAPIAITTPPGM